MKIPSNRFSRALLHLRWRLRDDFTNYPNYRDLTGKLRAHIYHDTGMKNPKIISRWHGVCFQEHASKVFMQAGSYLYSILGFNSKKSPCGSIHPDDKYIRRIDTSQYSSFEHAFERLQSITRWGI